MILKQSAVTFGVLLAAFAISALYQFYRATLMEVPEYDAFTPRRVSRREEKRTHTRGQRLPA